MSFDSGDVLGFGGGRVQRGPPSNPVNVCIEGCILSFFSPCGQDVPPSALPGCVLPHCSLVPRCSQLLAAPSPCLLCVCLSFWDEVCFSSSDRLARQTRLPFLFCFVFTRMAIFSPLKTILRLGRL